MAKHRAQGGAATLSAESVAADRIDLIKPDDSTYGATDLAGARRVAITPAPG